MADYSKNYPPAVSRALDILELICITNKPLSANEISKEHNLPLVSVYRLLHLLEDRLYIMADTKGSNKYVPGFKILELARSVNNKADISIATKPVMRRVAENTGQACMLAVIHVDGIMVIDQALPSKPVSILSALREKLPVNVTSNGKILTAFMNTEEQEIYLKKAWRFLPSDTVNTITNLELFRQELSIVKKRKYATDFEEYALGIGFLSVPIYNHGGQVIASLGITGHIADYKNNKKFNFMLHELIKGGEEISSNLGYKQENLY